MGPMVNARGRGCRVRSMRCCQGERKVHGEVLVQKVRVRVAANTSASGRGHEHGMRGAVSVRGLQRAREVAAVRVCGCVGGCHDML